MNPNRPLKGRERVGPPLGLLVLPPPPPARPVPTAHCSRCNVVIPDDGKVRKRLRERKCKACLSELAMKRRRENPVLLLQHRWSTNCSRHWPNAPNVLWSRETVKYVMDRWNNTSVLSNETDPQHLCIVPYVRDKQIVPTVQQLVLVTEKEAQSLARNDNDRRKAAFPQHVQDAMRVE